MVCVVLFPDALANLFTLALLGCADVLPSDVGGTGMAMHQPAWVLDTSAMQVEVEPDTFVVPDILQAIPLVCPETLPTSNAE